MHNKLVNHCTIELSLSPQGPILIKSGKQGADPTKPDMEFVETYHGGQRCIYLPGSSLKGAIRAHAERIVRTVGGEKPNGAGLGLWANDPLQQAVKKNKAEKIYQFSSFTEQIFGSTEMASRFRVEDAYPVGEVQLEERNGVAIDRVFGSTAGGSLFQFQVCTGGQFKTKIHLKNFSLAQLGLIGLVLRDLEEGWFSLGFAKSRGLGLVSVTLEKATVAYPGCIREERNSEFQLLGNAEKRWEYRTLLGAGEFLTAAEAGEYGFPKPDRQTETPVGAKSMDLGFGVEQVWSGEVLVKTLFGLAVKSWSIVLSEEKAA
ncbi:RAMP superfamily CRISPR-associated protein [Prochlorothrix hollandica]|uniref:CRISPR-associated protein n=1 Tax=Prochlorothrix hollandica PCC 9006 = CALU 1027 TaxID=317619 RepID=A0A0M2PZU1_PROHO|nr:RAMP superfamily CRISPR-associated protein [Prochlorothrix hollandica]KKI99896.1 CRISPR-associated protein [Prochlorothrix hollandica PCC 9006 = CALU 1027]